jgi:hypothetical protein
MRPEPRLAIFTLFFTLASGLSFIPASHAQQTSSGKSWTTSTQQDDPSGATNPYRTTTTHTEVNGRTVDRTVVEARGPDGRYVPYSVTERESVKINDTTVRNVERSYATNADGRSTLTQERREEARTLPAGESKTSTTVSNPDANGSLQVVQRTETDSKQVAPGARDTSTTVFSADGSGGLSASMRIEAHERQTDAKTVEFKQSTSLFDGVGHWNVSEIREGTTRQADAGTSKEERVLRPDAEGKMAVMERTVTRQADSASGEKRESTETYSTNVPGQAGDDGLKLVKRESTAQRSDANGSRTTMRQVETSNPGDPGAGLRVTQEAIDIVRPGTNGVAQQTSTTVARDANGNTNTVWVDIGQSDKPAPVKVETAPKQKK